MPLVDRDEYISRFAGAYGRLCWLVASALHAGCPQDDVLEASRGNGNDSAFGYVQMRVQRQKLNAIIRLARSIGVDDVELVDAARQNRTTIEQEFMCRIPRM